MSIRTESRGFWRVIGLLSLVFLGLGGWRQFHGTGSGVHSTPASPAQTLQRELLRENLGKPADPLLAAAFQDINLRHFDGALPDTPVLWEPRLSQVGAAAAGGFTLEGMFGETGGRTAILLNPDLQADKDAMTRALCHEMVHAYLHAIGDASTEHGPAFQIVLQRLSNEGAFKGLAATGADREQLRAWLDAESARLDAEWDALARLGEALNRDRAEAESAMAGLSARINDANARASSWPSEKEIADVTARRDAYNANAAAANDRAARDRADLEHFNVEVARFNLMLVYPDGVDDRGFVPQKTAPAAGVGVHRRAG